jgi:hypothetical protein
VTRRITRAKQSIKDEGLAFALPAGALGTRLESVLRVLYLIFNEGYATTTGAALIRIDLAEEAIRARSWHAGPVRGQRGRLDCREQAGQRQALACGRRQASVVKGAALTRQLPQRRVRTRQYLQFASAQHLLDLGFASLPPGHVIPPSSQAARSMTVTWGLDLISRMNGSTGCAH